MAFNKRKRTTSDRQEFQLPIEIKQYIKNLFEKKFTYKKPPDNPWKLPYENCFSENKRKTRSGKRNSPSKRHAKDISENQSDRSNQSCDSGMDESGAGINSQVVLNEIWAVHELLKMKNDLNELKNNLNDKDMILWHQHTRSVNLAGNIASEIYQSFRPELCTQAWCKFYEIASTYLGFLRKASVFSVHLCEAPGAFVTSLNHFMLSNGYDGYWDWRASTLNPYYEGNGSGQMINDDRFIRHTEHNWTFGADDTGDLMCPKNLEKMKSQGELAKIDLVTADGSIDCQGDPAEQEDVVSRLQHCEVLTALQILTPGGDFIIKMFTLLECKAISLMYLLNCAFEEVHVFKPCTSKGGNSEVYVICLKYKGLEDAKYMKQLSTLYFGDVEPQGCLFSQSQIPSSFLTQHKECTSFFKELQMASIQRNLDLYKEMSEEECLTLEEEKQFCSECFFEKYYIVPMENRWRLMKYKKKPQAQRESTSKASKFQKLASNIKKEGRFCGSFDDRQHQSLLPWKQRVMEYETYTIPDDCLVIWAENENFPVDCLRVKYGVPVKKIQSSRFCCGRLIQQTQDIVHNVKWLGDGSEINTHIVDTLIQKLVLLLTTSNMDLIGQDGDEQTTKDTESHSNSHDSSQASERSAEDERKMESECKTGSGDPSCDDVTVMVDTPIENSPVTKSPVLSGLMDQLSSSRADDMRRCVKVQMYNICAESLDEKFELREHYDMAIAVRDILQTCEEGGHVILEMRSCLTRMTAGLVYILYRLFKKVGFLSYHGNLLKQYLVCRHYSFNDLDLGSSDLKGYVKAVCETLSISTIPFNVLAVIPINILIEDSDFCNFLQSTNTRLLESFVTSVIETEQKLLSENTTLT